MSTSVMMDAKDFQILQMITSPFTYGKNMVDIKESTFGAPTSTRNPVRALAIEFEQKFIPYGGWDTSSPVESARAG